MPQSSRRTGNIPIFHALPPELVPRSRASSEAPEAARRDAAACSGLGARAASAELAAAIGRVLADMPVAHSRTAAPTACPAAGADDVALDSYFGIVRLEGDAPRIFLRSVLQANLILLEEVHEGGSSLDEAELHKLDDALAAVVSHVLALPRDPPARVRQLEPGGGARLRPDTTVDSRAPCLRDVDARPDPGAAGRRGRLNGRPHGRRRGGARSGDHADGRHGRRLQVHR